MPISLRSLVEGVKHLLRQGHNEIGALIARQVRFTTLGENI